MTQAYNLSQLANNLNSTGQLDATDGLVNAVPATNGGTGQAAYAVGDLLYAPTTTTLNKLADVATGNALLSGGVGVAPAYGKVGLTTHISGTLGIVNGGTGAATLASNNVLLGNGVGALQTIAPGTAGSVLTSNGTTWTSVLSTSPISVQIFSSSGTYFRPTGLIAAKITVVGGGGGGGYNDGTNVCGGGGGGGGAIRFVSSATLGASQSVTVGIGGAAGTIISPQAGEAGGASSFGALASATGGDGGAGITGVGSHGGIGSSGNLNMGGGSGNLAVGQPYVSGGASICGGGGGGGSAGRAYGGGGSCGSGGGSSSFAGASGVVIVEEYF